MKKKNLKIFISIRKKFSGKKKGKSFFSCTLGKTSDGINGGSTIRAIDFFCAAVESVDLWVDGDICF